MSGVTQYQQADQDRIAELLGELSAAEMRAVAPGWRGVFAEGLAVPSATDHDAGAPVLFAQWTIDYQRVTPSLDPEALPRRWGKVLIVFRLQHPCDRSAIVAAAQVVREHFSAAPRVPLQYQVEPPLERRGIEDGWITEVMPIEFYGGANG